MDTVLGSRNTQPTIEIRIWMTPEPRDYCSSCGKSYQPSSPVHCCTNIYTFKVFIYIYYFYMIIYICMCIIFYYLLLSLSTCILYIYMYTHVHCTCEWCSKRMHFQERPSCRRILSNICWQPWWMIDQGVTTHDYTTITYNYCNCLVKLEGIHLLARHESRRGLLAFLAEGFHIFLPSKSFICGVVILIHSKFMRGSPLVARASHVIAMPGV